MFSITVKGQSVQDLKMNLEVLINELDPSQVINAPLTDDPEDQLTHEEEMVLKQPIVKAIDAVVTKLEEVPKDLRELDSEGIPWDKRIHSASRGQVKDGTWRTRRNMEADFVATIKAELLQKIEREANPIAIPAAPITENTPITESSLWAGYVVEAPVVIEAAIVEAPVETPVESVAIEVAAPPVEIPKIGSGHSIETFTSQFAMIVASLITDGKITQEYVNQLKEYFKVDQIWQLTAEQISEVFTSFVQLGLVSKVA